MFGISVIICCYNSKKLLPDTFKYLALQQTTCLWDIIIVNNNSTDDTKEVAQKIWQETACNTPFQIIDEPRAGLSYARQKGVETSECDYFIFCDDDNWLDENYVQHAFDLIATNNKIGILGGKNTASFETEAPFWYKMMETTYAVGETNFSDGDVTHTRGRVFGAGMVLSRSFWQAIKAANFQTLLSDRKGKNLSTGGDTELCWYAKILGYEIHYSSRLTLQHFMASSRLSWAYCRKLQRGIGQSLTYLDMYQYVLLCIERDEKIGPQKMWHKIFWTNLKFLCRSPKRLFRFLYKDIEGEVYFCNYEYAYGRLQEMWKIRKQYVQIIDKLYQHIKSL